MYFIYILNLTFYKPTSPFIYFLKLITIYYNFIFSTFTDFNNDLTYKLQVSPELQSDSLTHLRFCIAMG